MLSDYWVAFNRRVSVVFTSAQKEAAELRQLAWVTISGGTSLVAACFFGGSWYLAEKIRSEALAVGPGPAMPAYDDVQFVGLSREGSSCEPSATRRPCSSQCSTALPGRAASGTWASGYLWPGT
jgi:hypothetical protein